MLELSVTLMNAVEDVCTDKLDLLGNQRIMHFYSR